MKTVKLVVIVMLIALSGCANGRWFPKGLSPELAHKCQINPYDPDCIDPPPLFQGPR